MTEFPALLIGSLSAIAASAAAFAAYRAAAETRRAAQASVATALLDAYASPEMLAAIATVHAWEQGTAIALDGDIDRARRRISHHFKKIATLANADLLDARLLPSLVPLGEADLFCRIIQPMERQINPDYDTGPFKRFERLYYGHPSVPRMQPR